jgi:hypothetical protein
MSNAEKVRRYAQTQKFYATLPHKIDESVEEYLASVDEALIAEWEFWEELDGDTPLGGTMSVSYKNNNTHKRDKG